MIEPSNAGAAKEPDVLTEGGESSATGPNVSHTLTLPEGFAVYGHAVPFEYRANIHKARCEAMVKLTQALKYCINAEENNLAYGQAYFEKARYSAMQELRQALMAPSKKNLPYNEKALHALIRALKKALERYIECDAENSAPQTHSVCSAENQMKKARDAAMVTLKRDLDRCIAIEEQVQKDIENAVEECIKRLSDATEPKQVLEQYFSIEAKILQSTENWRQLAREYLKQTLVRCIAAEKYTMIERGPIYYLMDDQKTLRQYMRKTEACAKRDKPAGYPLAAGDYLEDLVKEGFLIQKAAELSMYIDTSGIIPYCSVYNIQDTLTMEKYRDYVVSEIRLQDNIASLLEDITDDTDDDISSYADSDFIYPKFGPPSQFDPRHYSNMSILHRKEYASLDDFNKAYEDVLRKQGSWGLPKKKSQLEACAQLEEANARWGQMHREYKADLVAKRFSEHAQRFLEQLEEAKAWVKKAGHAECQAEVCADISSAQSEKAGGLSSDRSIDGVLKNQYDNESRYIRATTPTYLYSNIEQVKAEQLAKYRAYWKSGHAECQTGVCTDISSAQSEKAGGLSSDRSIDGVLKKKYDNESRYIRATTPTYLYSNIEQVKAEQLEKYNAHWKARHAECQAEVCADISSAQSEKAGGLSSDRSTSTS